MASRSLVTPPARTAEGPAGSVGQIVTIRPPTQPVELPTEEQRWDRALERLGGNLLQSWRWGEFKKRQGWEVERLHHSSRAGEWMAQVFFKRAGPLSIAYLPCGPTLDGDHGELFPELLAAVDALCRDYRAVTLIMEPNQRLELEGTYKSTGFVAWPKPLQPRHTWQVTTHPDDELLAKMHHKKRYHVRLAMRHGFTFEHRPPTAANIDLFHRMHVDTAQRQGITSFSVSYLIDQLETFGDRGALVFVTAGDLPLASAVFARFGEEATYLSAASSIEHRGQGAGAFLIYQATRMYRDQGCTRVDLGNIGPEGLRTFKTGFDGVASHFPTAMERRYGALRSWLARRIVATRY